MASLIGQVFYLSFGRIALNLHLSYAYYSITQG